MQDVDYWHKLVAAEMDRQNVRKYPHENPVILRFWFNDRLDCSNHAIYVKMIEDAMKGRVIKDDNRTWVQGVEMYFHDEDCIRVMVKEV
jgi:Holliday junction resolvase RusA-like endonuclease